MALAVRQVFLFGATRLRLAATSTESLPPSQPSLVPNQRELRLGRRARSDRRRLSRPKRGSVRESREGGRSLSALEPRYHRRQNCRGQTSRVENRSKWDSAPFMRHITHMRGVGNRFVYIIRSASAPTHHYVGITSHVDRRLEWHTHGPCGWTLHHRPWSVVVTIEFPTEKQARRFEKYLKSGSGRAFAERHFSPKR